MGKAPVLIKINSNQGPVLVIAVFFRYAEVFSPVIFLKKRLKVPTLQSPKSPISL